jgi:4-amino-4-deoxy-L-arabinose transferase-like glycosyltransferase
MKVILSVRDLCFSMKPFWLLTLAVVLGLTLPFLIQDAMFQDAVLYSAVSHNLSIGFGTFWFPQYSTLNLEGIPSFHEQPPLFFGIQAIFYKILGDSRYVERFITVVMLLLHVVLMNEFWKIIFQNQPTYKKLGWLPALFWILIPICFWSFRNNMIENTLSVFTLCSVLIGYKTIQKTAKNNVFAWCTAGFCLFLASFCKGVPGLFPIAFPLLYWAITRNITLKQSLSYTFWLLAVPVVCYGLFLLHPESRQSLSIYFFERLIRRVNVMPTADYRLEIVWRLFTELLPILLLSMAILFFSSKEKRLATIAESKKTVLLFLVIGLSASFPLTLTMVQKGWYLVPSFPYFALAFSVLIVPIIASKNYFTDNQAIKYPKIAILLPVLMLLGIFYATFLQKDKIDREAATLTDVYKIGAIVPKFSTVTVPLAQYDQYNFVLQGFFVRYFNISISPYQQYDYFLKEKKSDALVPTEYQKVDMALSKYELYRKSIK